MKNLKYFLAGLVLILWALPAPAPAQFDHQYQLYQNREKFGIVVFPKTNSFVGLEDYIGSIGFDPVASGKAVMRYGPRGLNQTLMMPREVQEKHSVKRFIIIQVLGDHSMLVGVFDPDWELTLPSTIFSLDEVKQNIPKTLDIFRKSAPRKEIRQFPPDGRQHGVERIST